MKLLTLDCHLNFHHVVKLNKFGVKRLIYGHELQI